MRLRVDDRERRVLVDSGCTDNLIFAPCCEQWTRRDVALATVGGQRLCCDGVGRVTVETPEGRRVTISVLVLGQRPLGVDLILGMSGIVAVGGVVVRSPSDVSFCGAACTDAVKPSTESVRETPAADPKCSGATSIGGCESRRQAALEAPAPDRAGGRPQSVVRSRGDIPPLEVEAPDYLVRFDASKKIWVVSWKWSGGSGPEYLTNTAAQYNVSPDMRHQFEEELSEWVSNGWLVPYDEQRLGPPRALIPLMAVRQRNQDKVRPVLDYRELNSHITAHTADADVCAEQLRRWRRRGNNVAIVDLRKAYLQLHVDPRLWPYQTVKIGGTRYCLTRLGFGLSVAPEVMRSVVQTILQQDAEMQRAVLGYVDDLLVDETVVSAEAVMNHFARFGLQCKPPVRAADGARMLGLRVFRTADGLQWRRDNAVDSPPVRITRRAVFSWCGQLVAHLPLCGWLRPAAAWMKRRANSVTRGWDDEADDAALRGQMRAVWERLAADDPAAGPWCVSGDSAVVWTDASSLAVGVLLASCDGAPIEDACWLRRDDSGHINMAELDAAIRGINLAVAWGMSTIDVRTDSVTVHHWIGDAVSGRARLRTKAQSELLIRRRVSIIRQLVDELSLTLSVTLVRSAENRADALTRVPAEWLRDARGAAEGPAAAAAAAPCGGDRAVPSVAEIHARAGHPGVRRTLYFARREITGGVARAEVQAVVAQCDVCRSIDPSPLRLPRGDLEVDEVWARLAIDITHYRNRNYLTVIDCGQSRFCLWRLLRRPDADSVVEHLDSVFCERGAPAELLCDNDTVFRSRRFGAFAASWRVTMRFRAAYAPSGNGIIERNHRTVKVIAARKQCSIDEAVHLYNVSPRDAGAMAEAPVSAVYKYSVRDRVSGPRGDGADLAAPSSCSGKRGYSVGDLVWVRCRGTRCSRTSVPGAVTAVVSQWVMEVDGVPRHVRDIRRRDEPGPPADHSAADEAPDADELLVMQLPAEAAPAVSISGAPGTAVSAPAVTRSEAAPAEASVVPRRSSRIRRPIRRYCCEFGDCHDHEDQEGV